MNEQNQDALRCADALRQLESAKKHHPSGPGGQMMGCESYRLIASGFSFYELQNSADHLDRLVAENEAKDALLRQAWAVIRWQCFGECRTEGVDGLPTPSEVDLSIRQHLNKSKK